MPAPVRTGSAVRVDASAASGSVAITVPADATGIVVFWSFYDSGGGSLSTLTLGGVALSIKRNVAVVVGSRLAVGVAALHLPLTGSQTLAWAWTGASGALDEGGGLYCVFVKDNDPSSGFIRDHNAATASSSTNPGPISVASQTDDLVLGAINSGGAPDGATGGQTVFLNNDLYNTRQTDLVQEDAPGASTTSVSTVGTLDYSTICAVSIKAIPQKKARSRTRRPEILLFVQLWRQRWATSAPATGGGGGTQYTKSLDGAIGMAGALTKSTSTTKAGTLATAGALVKQTSRALAGALATSGALLKQARKVLAGSVATAGALTSVKVLLRTVSGTIASSSALLKQTGKTLAGTVTTSGALVRQARKVLAGALVSAGALTKRTSRALTGAVSSAGSLTAVKVLLRTVSGAIATSGALQRLPQKAVGGTIATAGALSRHVSTFVAGTIATSGTLTKRTARALSGAIALVGTLTSGSPTLLFLSVVTRTARRRISVVTAKLRSRVVLPQQRPPDE